ncbi:hypothetical protein I656_02082 [Geobacillus sp. WSUCF1]|nr:hypothetical protein I656_02082 [Geobacillus sp. WSUCF1]
MFRAFFFVFWKMSCFLYKNISSGKNGMYKEWRFGR